MHCDDGGQHMRKSLVALLLAGGAVAIAANLAVASSFDVAPEMQAKRAMPVALQSKAAKLGTSATADTVYVGFTPGHSGDNYWSIFAGNNRVSAGSWHRPPAKGGMWDWEPPYTDVHGDSLQGWWPIRLQFTGTLASLHDYDMPMRAGEWGNVANYIIYQAAPHKRTF